MCKLNIYSVNIPEKLSSYEFEIYMKEIPFHTQNRIRRYIKQQDAIRSLFSQLLLQKVIQKEKNVKRDELLFYKNIYGKPYLSNMSNYHFNISHSGKYVVCVTHNEQVGIDIEHIKPISLDITKYFCTLDEYKYILTQPKERHTSLFYDFWTLKESFIKAIGKGLSIPLDSFEFECENGEFFIKENFYSNEFFFKQYNINPGYKLSVCAKSIDFPREIKEIHYSSFYTK
ncbi:MULTISPECIES: 4'-phosphopantetheinyl transferase family protein [Bacillus]|uniref:Phosphopantetheine-protein transferase domain protein n=2 Tax=Bacillus cereus group TaxID=86661 RepID=R8CWW9_BACCE|nr:MULTISPECIES: 4'-phosphopantetheinyl transferase superfamily protein [Bacillus cereus group]NIE92204.1 4'-phosphopantetheinyl transferase superfamily protein [Bacillus sp. Ab-1751]EOO16144.1 phosphopantetheine-protein transferase domain protein [Bacillus cereus HuA3-9]MCU5332259.1 4'-phosphopantetheinyl transferase superfamily protein [Bacillus wiedmannii]PEV20668.1 phosphopantetheinyl transferase [Bacillus thuringiensis]PEX65841.1 phosphopantetheinyl transferase [Bacillus cereus]